MSQKLRFNTDNTVQVSPEKVLKKMKLFVGCDEGGDDVFKLKAGGDDIYEEGACRRNSSVSSMGNLSEESGGWESSLSEFEDAEHEEKFKSLRAQHYFMKQAIARGKELIGTDDEEEEEEMRGDNEGAEDDESYSEGEIIV